MGKILVVDNDQDFLEFIGERFRQNAFFKEEIILASSFQEAIQVISAREIDFVLTDVDLNDALGGTGFDLISLARQHNPKVGAALMSGDDKWRKLARKSRAVAFLRKPEGILNLFSFIEKS